MIEFNYDPQRNIVTIYPMKAISILDISEYVQKNLADSNIKTGFMELVDFQEVEDFQFTYDEALTLPAIYAELKNRKDHKGIIIITKNNLQYGMARMCSMIMEDYLDIHVVRSVEETEKLIKLIHGQTKQSNPDRKVTDKELPSRLPTQESPQKKLFQPQDLHIMPAH